VACTQRQQYIIFHCLVYVTDISRPQSAHILLTEQKHAMAPQWDLDSLSSASIPRSVPLHLHTERMTAK